MVLVNVALHLFFTNILISVPVLFLSMLVASMLSGEPQKIYLRYTLGCTLLTMSLNIIINVIRNSSLLLQPYYIIFALLAGFFMVSTITLMITLSVYAVMKTITGADEKC